MAKTSEGEKSNEEFKDDLSERRTPEPGSKFPDQFGVVNDCALVRAANKRAANMIVAAMRLSRSSSVLPDDTASSYSYAWESSPSSSCKALV